MWTLDLETVDPAPAIIFATMLLLCVICNGLLLAFSAHILYRARSAVSAADHSNSAASVSALFIVSFFNGFIGPLLYLSYVISCLIAHRAIGGLHFCVTYAAPVFLATNCAHAISMIAISTLRWLSIVKEKSISNRLTIAIFSGVWLWHVVFAGSVSRIPDEMAPVDRHGIMCGLRVDGKSSVGVFYVFTAALFGIPWVARCNIAISKQVKVVTSKASSSGSSRLLLQVQASTSYMTLSFCFLICGVVFSYTWILIRKITANTVDTWSQYSVFYSMLLFHLDIAIKPIIALLTVKQYRRHLYKLCGIRGGHVNSPYSSEPNISANQEPGRMTYPVPSATASNQQQNARNSTNARVVPISPARQGSVGALQSANASVRLSRAGQGSASPLSPSSPSASSASVGSLFAADALAQFPPPLPSSSSSLVPIDVDGAPRN